MDHTCAPPADWPKQLSCGTCGRFCDPKALRSIRFQGFTGPASLNSNVETFWETGDPDVFTS